MQPSTGHLVSNIEDLPESVRGDYVRVPAHLNRAARRKLDGKPEAYVSLTSGGALSQFAAQQRKRKAKRKAVKAARKRNRGG